MPPKSSFNFFSPGEPATAALPVPVSPTFDSTAGKAQNYQALGEAVANFNQPGGKSKIVINFIGMKTDEVKAFLGDSVELRLITKIIATGFSSALATIKPLGVSGTVNILSKVDPNAHVCMKKMDGFGDEVINLSIVNLEGVDEATSRDRIKDILQAHHDCSGAICVVKEAKLTSFADLISCAQATYKTHLAIQRADQAAADDEFEAGFEQISDAKTVANEMRALAPVTPATVLTRRMAAAMIDDASEVYDIVGAPHTAKPPPPSMRVPVQSGGSINRGVDEAPGNARRGFGARS